MARGDDSVIRGSLITCVIFLFLSLVGNYFMYQAMDRAQGERENMNKKFQTADAKIRSDTSKIQAMEYMLGQSQFTEAEFEAASSSASSDETYKKIRENFDQDMSLLTAGLAKNYHTFPGFFTDAVRQLNEEKIQTNDELERVKVDIEKLRNSSDSRIADAEKAKKDLNNTLLKERQEFAADREKHIVAQENMKDVLTRNQQAALKASQVAARTKAGLEKNLTTLQTTVDVQADKIFELQDDEFESAQGRVVHVMPGANRVFISLGSEDGLRTGVTFGVIDQDEIRVTDVEPKANLEVTAIRGSHLAEARVIYNKSLRNPIIEDDKIYTPFWAPGRQVEIALAGTMDIDGDGNDDIDRIVAMIGAAGAKVSARVDSEGNELGELTFDTRFLVLGTQPEFRTTDNIQLQEGNKTILASVGKLKSKAKTMGITSISLTKLLGYLRSLDEGMVIPLGSAAVAEDFPPTTPPGANRRRVSTVSSLYDQDSPLREGN